MATRLYSISPGAPFQISSVTEASGSAVTTAAIELTVDLATSAVNDGGTTRSIKKDEVLKALELFAAYLLADTWPPA